MTFVKRLLCRIVGHRTFTLWTAGGGDVWGDGCYRCGAEQQSAYFISSEGR